MACCAGLLLVAGLAVRADPPPKPETSTAPGRPAVVSTTTTVTNRFDIRGMHCEACAKGIAAEVRKLPGVNGVDVSFAKRLAIVAYDAHRLSPAALVRAVEEAGYEAKLQPTRRRARP